MMHANYTIYKPRFDIRDTSTHTHPREALTAGGVQLRSAGNSGCANNEAVKSVFFYW